MEPNTTTDPHQRHALHIKVTKTMVDRIDGLVGTVCVDRSEVVRALIAAGLDALEERWRTGRAP
jgi:hypothetical protein